MFFQKNFPFIYLFIFWQNCLKIRFSPNNPKFSTGRHPYILSGFWHLCFILFSSNFLDKFGPIILCSPNWLEFGTGMHYYMPIKNFTYFFNMVFIQFVLGQVWFQIWCTPNWFKFITGAHCYMLLTVFTLSFYKNFLFSFLG